ncbi:MAG: multiprotein-bridging factor 1 family protein [Hyphomicrobiaceae bacterium]
MSSLIGPNRREALARRVRLEMAKRGLTRERLAEMAEVKERTLGNLLAGQSVRDVTVAKVARVLEIELEELGLAMTEAAASSESSGGHAAEAYGGYMLAAYEGYLGTYVAFRRVFSERSALYRSVYEIDWDEAMLRLRFLELPRTRSQGRAGTAESHGGGIYISPHTGLLQLLTTYQGALRLVTLNRFRNGESRLRGIVLTQSDRDRFFEPAASAIFLDRLDEKQRLTDLERLVGMVGPEDPAFAEANAVLSGIERSGMFVARSTG